MKYAVFMPTLCLTLIVSLMAQDADRSRPFEILGFKITSDYYPMLDRGSPIFTADNPDMPRTPVEERTGQGPVTGRRRGISGQQDRSRSTGKLRSQIKIIGGADNVSLSLRNNSAKNIASIEWDFAFPRFVDGALVLRYDVTSKVDIRPGGKKTIKYPLPHGATRCKTVSVKVDPNDPDGGKVFEAVCGPGVDDPSHLQQETVLIKRIRYEDGSEWLK